MCGSSGRRDSMLTGMHRTRPGHLLYMLYIDCLRFAVLTGLPSLPPAAACVEEVGWAAHCYTR